MDNKSKYSPGQTCVLQFVESLVPAVHVRVLDFVPPPHERLHVPQIDQEEYPEREPVVPDNAGYILKNSITLSNTICNYVRLVLD